MKQLLSVFCLTISFLLNGHAQVAYESGMNMTNMFIKVNDMRFTTKFKPGVSGGIFGDIPMSDNNFYLQIGLFAKYVTTETKLPEGIFNLGATDLLLSLQYKTGTKCAPRFFCGAGPAINFIQGGSFSYDAYNDHGVFRPEKTVNAIRRGPTLRDDIKQRALSLNLNVGYVFKKHFFLHAHYMQGISNLIPLGNKENTLKASIASLHMGYYIGGCRVKKDRGFSRTKGVNHWHGMSYGKYSRRPISSYRNTHSTYVR